MSLTKPTLSLEQFRQEFDSQKPNYEYWDGKARQKAIPTKLHAKLQWTLAAILSELGFCSFTELTLRIDSNWEPVPDVTATVDDFAGPYPDRSVDVVLEILSPQDSFTAVETKCERYASSGIQVILVFDPVERKVWKWDARTGSAVRVREQEIPLHSGRPPLNLNAVWERFDSR